MPHMSTSAVISLDLHHGAGDVVDVTGFFPLSELHAIRSTKPLLDSIGERRYATPDLSLSRTLRIGRFRTLAMLDLARSELFATDMIGETFFREKARPHTLDVVDPLDIPYGALDIRREEVKSDKKYGDLYRRSLPISLHARRISRDTRRYLMKKRKVILSTLLILVALSLPTLLYTKILIESWYRELASISHLREKTALMNSIHSARKDFERANVLMLPYRYLPWDTMKMARAALGGGLSISRWLDRLVMTLPETSTGTTEMIGRTTGEKSLYRPDAQNITLLAFLGIDKPTEWLRDNTSDIEYFARSLETAGREYESLDSIDHPRAREAAHIGRAVTRISGIIDTYLRDKTGFLALLWADTPERYIVFNQNRDEIRTNGGFPGSVITFTLYKGNIEDFRTDDVYYYDWNLYPYKEPPPPWLALISGNYGLRDVNYYPDFHDTLEKANNFIEKSWDPTVTVWVAIHQGIVEKMLATMSGWVTLSGISMPFTDESFSSLMSVLVESRYGERTSAKDILADFVDAFLHRLSETRNYSEVLDIITDSIENGEILFASRNDQIDTFLSKYRKPLPWQTSGKNWIYPTLTSLSGNKSDRYIERLYTAETTSIGNCTYENKLTFTHTHTFSKEKEQEIQSTMDLAKITDPLDREKMLFIQGKWKNTAYVRLFVPPTSLLTGSVAGITLTPGKENSEIAFTLATTPGATTSKIVRYTIRDPWCDGSLPILEWYRQPGLQNTKMRSR